MRSTLCSFLLLFVLFGGNRSSFGQCTSCPDKRTISVTGTGSVTADADRAIVRVGYKFYGADAKTLYATATQTSNAIMDSLTQSGIAKKAIESTSQVIQHTQQYEYGQYPVDSDEWRNRQFTALQSWIIRVRPDDAAGALNTAIKAGANESGWIEWVVNEPEPLQAEASAKAVADARAVAEKIASKSNVRLGQLVNVYQNPQQYPYGGNMGGGVYSAGIQSGVISGVQYGNQQLAINSRRVEFTVSVNAVFAIE